MLAAPTKAAALLRWRTTRGLDAMCGDLWRWQRGNPQGYPPADRAPYWPHPRTRAPVAPLCGPRGEGPWLPCYLEKLVAVAADAAARAAPPPGGQRVVGRRQRMGFGWVYY